MHFAATAFMKKTGSVHMITSNIKYGNNGHKKVGLGLWACDEGHESLSSNARFTMGYSHWMAA